MRGVTGALESAPLAEVQRQFQAYVLQESAVPPAVVSGGVVSTGTTVYAEAYVLRLLEALLEDYPALRALLGESGFAEVARAYAFAHPSDHFSIRWFGRRLAYFLRVTPPYSAEHYLAELAAFEWALSEAFDAADAGPLDGDYLQHIPGERWPSLVFSFHPSLRNLRLRYDVGRLWQSLVKSGAAPEALAPGGARRWLIWRHELEVYFRCLDATEALAFDAVRDGATLADACDMLAERVPAEEMAGLMASWLRQWLREGLIVRADVVAT